MDRVTLQPAAGAHGELTGIMMVKACLEAVYLSGWQVAADANTAGQTYPDQSLYPADSVPNVVRRINRAFQRADQIARAEGKDPVRRVLSARVFREAGFTCFEVTAESFLWQMVRGMAGALIAVGSGEMDEEGLARLLEAPPGERFPPAPSSGLVLWEVDCGIGFAPLERSPRSSAFLATVRGHHEIMAHISSFLEEGR